MEILNESKPLENDDVVMPFEVFFLGELLAEGIIDQALFNKAYEKLSKEINLNKKENELEELEL